MKIITPVGPIWLDADESGLKTLTFSEHNAFKTNAFTLQAEKELNEYFLGNRKKFNLKLSINVGTKFQQNVWKALTKIPFGQTATYQDIAQRIDSPKAFRAVGQANSKNPIPIIIPCHRIIGKNGALTGYLGSSKENGLSIKQKLLEIEKI